MDENIKLHIWMEKKTPLYQYILTSQYFNIVEDPANADIILLEDDNPDSIKKKDVFKKYPAKCITVNETDTPSYFLPGCYASNRKWILSKNRTKTIPYIVAQHLIPNGYVRYTDPKGKKKYLYSFRGGSTSWIRKKLFKQVFNTPDVLVQDANSYQHWNYDQSYNNTKQTQQQEYADLLTESSFFLCPRGAGISSIRVFEVMKAGRVPVIIADQWVRADKIPWEEISITVAERDIAQIDKIVRGYESKAAWMGDNARKAWEQYCAPDVDLLFLAHSIKEVQAQRKEWRERIIRSIHPMFQLSKTFKDMSRGVAKKVILKAYSIMGKKFPYSLNRPIEDQVK